MNKEHTQSSSNEVEIHIKPDWDQYFPTMRAVVESLTPVEQKRYLNQLKRQGYSDQQIEQLRAAVQNNG